MSNRLISAAVIVLFAVCCVVLNCSAQQEKEELKTRLRDLRQKKTEATNEYNNGLEKINKESDDKIAKLKRDFRIAREECLENKHKKSDELRKDFEGKLKPILKEENGLVEQIGRDAREDFAKVRPKKAR